MLKLKLKYTRQDRRGDCYKFTVLHISFDKTNTMYVSQGLSLYESQHAVGHSWNVWGWPKERLEQRAKEVAKVNGRKNFCDTSADEGVLI